LARTLQEQNRYADARTYLERAAGAVKELPPETAPAHRRHARGAGRHPRAAKVLESDRDALDLSGELLLAEFYKRLGRTNDAEAIYVKRLSNPPIALEPIRAAADFYGSQGKIEQAQKVLERSPETKASPGAADLIRRASTNSYISPESAPKFYVAATTRRAEEPAGWHQLVAYHLHGGEYDDAPLPPTTGLRAFPTMPASNASARSRRRRRRCWRRTRRGA
jgi:tetratricopeptide (TPR) repeat protein